MTELEELLNRLDIAIQTREAAYNTGRTNHSVAQANQMVKDAKEAIYAHVASLI